MKNAIFIEAGKHLTLNEYLPIASRTMSLITEAAKGVNEIKETFSVTDLAALLNKICRHMAGEFEIRNTPSHYVQIVYTADILNEAGFDEGYIVSDFVDTHDCGQNTLWVNEKAVIGFMDRNLCDIAFILYFYLGYLMTQDDTFGISHNISFQQILESCAEFPEDCLKHQTTLMRALADLEDAGLIKWYAKSHTFELLYITPYDPNEKV